MEIIVNVEAQNKYNPGYPLIKRGVYYVSRMISAQNGVDFKNGEYGKLKKVCSIWICLNAPKERRNSITRYTLREEQLVGNSVEAAKNYDLISVVMICLGDAQERQADVLRMLDVPLPTIKAVLRGEQSLQQALQAQQTVLEQQAVQLAEAMQFCADLARQAPQTDTLDVDACLTRMESPAPQQGFFSGWLQDYCTLTQVQHQKHFFFIPQGSINTPQEFTAALQTYAEEKEIQFTLTKEGMYPEFSLDGIAYKAYRNPGKYRDEICCDAVHPEQLDAGLPPKREKLLRILRIAVPPVCRLSPIMAAGWVVTGGAGWLWLAVLASAGVLLGRCFEKWL